MWPLVMSIPTKQCLQQDSNSANVQILKKCHSLGCGIKPNMKRCYPHLSMWLLVMSILAQQCLKQNIVQCTVLQYLHDYTNK
ncbi:hypothetical protein E2C01_016713 [Portunus trituberculatus]|uniref:Uncharacterized protein n=1 Tax=Portunus trituberculatus TaxID=210409 RepID=A0A5B7DRH9_PORTR|nr:hypothetical protein [Portunus trituberculatus]